MIGNSVPEVTWNPCILKRGKITSYNLGVKIEKQMMVNESSESTNNTSIFNNIIIRQLSLENLFYQTEHENIGSRSTSPNLSQQSPE